MRRIDVLRRETLTRREHNIISLVRATPIGVEWYFTADSFASAT
jgi:hypothetical protein